MRDLGISHVKKAQKNLDYFSFSRERRSRIGSIGSLGSIGSIGSIEKVKQPGYSFLSF